MMRLGTRYTYETDGLPINNFSTIEGIGLHKIRRARHRGQATRPPGLRECIRLFDIRVINISYMTSWASDISIA